MNMGKTVTTIKVDEKIWKQMKIQAILQDRKINDCFQEAMEMYLQEHHQTK